MMILPIWIQLLLLLPGNCVGLERLEMSAQPLAQRGPYAARRHAQASLSQYSIFIPPDSRPVPPSSSPDRSETAETFPEDSFLDSDPLLQEIVIQTPQDRHSRVPTRIFSAKSCPVCLEGFGPSIPPPPIAELAPQPQAHPRPTSKAQSSPTTSEPETGSPSLDPRPTPPVPIHPDLHPSIRDLSAPGSSNPEAQPSRKESSATTSTHPASGSPLRDATVSSAINSEVPATKIDLSQPTIVSHQYTRWKLSQLRCGHMFHLTCIDRWLDQKGTCPTCRIGIRPPKVKPSSTPISSSLQFSRINIPASRVNSENLLGEMLPHFIGIVGTIVSLYLLVAVVRHGHYQDMN